MTHLHGQALVEFALILPLLLMLSLGGVSVGLLLLDRYELQHAATEGAIAGADNRGASDSNPSRAERCRDAIGTATRILGRRPMEASCTARSRMVELHLAENLPLLIPFVGDNWRVAVVARSEFRR
jgi:Flp pilus assembly protein TadG